SVNAGAKAQASAGDPAAAKPEATVQRKSGKMLYRRRSSVLDGLLSGDKGKKQLSSSTVQHVGHWRGGGPRRRATQEDLTTTQKEDSDWDKKGANLTFGPD
ncbi:unnamed protein product, partial [Amoebophrya sp. A120]